MRTWRNYQTRELVQEPDMVLAIRSQFEYRDGVVIRKSTGKLITSRTSNGYQTIGVLGGKVLTHHLVWLLHNDFLPQEVDHEDRNRANNRIENLRAATSGQNRRNRTKSLGKTSKYQGVSWNKQRGAWVAEIRLPDYTGRKWLGFHETETEAALAYNQAAIMYHGEFASLNQIEEG